MFMGERETMTDYDEDSLFFSSCHLSPLTCADTVEYPCHQVGFLSFYVGAEIELVSERLEEE